MEKKLQFYNEKVFDKVVELLEPYGCRVFFNKTEDEGMAKKRVKCRVEIYRKIGDIPFNEQIDKMLDMVKEISL